MRERDPSRTIGQNLEAFLLLELLRAPSYGYDLTRRLGEYGFRRAVDEPGVVYKVLRNLEDVGAIHSEWQPQSSGPARRYYEISESGRTLLRQRVLQLKRYVARVERLLGGDGAGGRGDGAGRAAVLLNAGAAVYVAGLAGTYAEGVERATEALGQGLALRALERLRRASASTSG